MKKQTIIVIILTVIFIFTRTAFAISREDKLSRIKELSDEINRYETVRISVEKETKSLENELTKMETEYKKLITDVDLTQEQIDLLGIEMTDISKDILLTENKIINNREALKKSVRIIYQSENQTLIESILSKERLADVWSDQGRQKTFQSKLSSHVKDLRFYKTKLKDARVMSKGKKSDLDRLRIRKIDKKKIAILEQKKKKILIEKTKLKEKAFRGLIDKKKKLVKLFEDELYRYESTLEFVPNNDALPKIGSSVLSWPLDSVFITQRFGKTVDSKRLYLSGSHSGVDFRANNDSVYAMADGVVIGVGDTDIACRGASFGKWILIAYENNLTSTYGHLSLIKVSPGQKVKSGELVGYSGDTGRTFGPHLHVSLYAGVDAYGKSPVKIKGKESLVCKGKILVQPRAPHAAYLDALDYLPYATQDMFKNQ